jgi:hypothetical protein
MKLCTVVHLTVMAVDIMDVGSVVPFAHTDIISFGKAFLKLLLNTCGTANLFSCAKWIRRTWVIVLYRERKVLM